MADESNFFIFIVGPTATGKTELSLRVAESLGWPIINCDSVQVYRRVDIGTAKPSDLEKARAPHFLFDYVEPPQKLTVADYLRDVQFCLKKHNISKAVFVGGSGFYIQALQKGLYPDSETPHNIKREINEWIEEEGYDSLYDWLQQRDPEFTKTISANDHYRIQRSVEVMKTQGETMSQLKAKMADHSHSPLPEHGRLQVGLSTMRDQLRPRVQERTRKMLENGFVEEVRTLFSRGLADWAPLNSVGYKEVGAFLGGEISEVDLEERIVTATMQLIKKQQTWFKREPEIQWFTPEEIETAHHWILSQLTAD